MSLREMNSLYKLVPNGTKHFLTALLFMQGKLVKNCKYIDSQENTYNILWFLLRNICAHLAYAAITLYTMSSPWRREYTWQTRRRQYQLYLRLQLQAYVRIRGVNWPSDVIIIKKRASNVLRTMCVCVCIYVYVTYGSSMCNYLKIK